LKKLITYLLLGFAFLPQLALSQEKTRENFIRDFTKEHFITWPESKNRKEVFTIAVINDSSLYTNLIPFFDKKPLFRKRRIKLVYYNSFNAAKSINVGLIYLNASEGLSMNDAISAVKGKPILVVGENFPYNQSMINLVSIENKISFEFNKVLIEGQGLTPTAELSKLSAKNEIQWNKMLAEAETKLASEKALTENNSKQLRNTKNQLYNAKQDINAKEKQLSEKDELIDSAHQQISLRQREIEVEKKENILKSQKITEQNRYILLISIAIAFALIAIFFVYRSYSLSRKANHKLSDLNKALKAHKDEIFNQKIVVEEKSKEITDSINYALRIQRSLLPSIKDVNLHFKESFIIFKPKDIVSGDFYWAEKLPQNRVLFTVSDCTGHGVPGALMSVIGINQLNKIVHENRITSPEQILRELDLSVRATLHQHNHEDGANDGMEMAICLLEIETNTLYFSGAFNPLWIVTQNPANPEFTSYIKEDPIKGSNATLIEIPPDKKSVASTYKTDYNFKLHKLKLTKGDCIYIFSDGYVDQFGGKDAKKFKKMRFKELLIKHNQEPMANQKNVILTNFDDWKGQIEQIDDVCVMGVRV
jgi:serine phosphatase RsbU (regulator of sigma subunit)